MADEQLVEQFYAGDQSADSPANRDKSALETLLNRYNTIILTYLFTISFFKNEQYLADVRQKVLITIFNELSNHNFASIVEGSFKKWVYRITYFACINSDRERRADMKTTSDVFPEEETDLSNLVLMRTTPSTSDYEEVEEQLNEVSARLTDEELELMKLVSQKVPYKKIRERQEFQKYSVDYLKHKVHNIRKRMREKE
jgi:DNA-directed RNA polymerase specialized sigma24 family protein